MSATRKTWLRRADGKRSLLRTYPSVSLAEARKACAEMHMASAAVTVEGAAERFIQAHARHLRSGVQVEWLLRKHVIPRIGDRAIASIGRADVAALLRAVQGPDSMKRARIANLTRAAMSRMWKWAVSEGMAASNPAAQVERRKGEKSRDRVLSDDELHTIWQVCEDWPQPSPFGTIVQLLILTGQRRDEVANISPSGFDDFQTGLWRIPAARMKAGREHTVPLPSFARHVLFMSLKISQTPPPGKPGAPGPALRSNFTSWSKSKVRLDRLSGVTGWRLNDLRRTAASGMVRLGAPRDIVDQVLGHAVRGAGAVYIRESDLVAMRDALDRWGAHMETLVAPRLPGLL